MSYAAAPPPLSTPASSGFGLANWWHNGWACRTTVLLAGLAFLNLFETWEPDYRPAGYSQTQWEGGLRWVILFSFGLIVSGAFFARRKGGDHPLPVPN